MDDLDLLNNLLKRIDVVGLEMTNFTLLLNTSQTRITYKLKLPDAIIAATSAANNASLITADKGFNKVKGIRVVGF